MFENYKGAKNRKMPKWAPPLIIAALVFHAAALMTMWIKSIWEVEKLELPKGRISLSGQFAPPPPPPPPKAGKKPEDKKEIIKKKKVEELVQKPLEDQIMKPDQATSQSTAETGIGEGEGEGADEGSGDGPPVEAAPPPPPAPPQNVAPTALKANQIAGEQQIIPDDVTKIEIQRSGKAKVVASFKMCINAGGSPQSVTMLKSTGFPAYDTKIKREMNNWRYRPFLINGRAAPVCTAVTFIYSQK